MMNDTFDDFIFSGNVPNSSKQIPSQATYLNKIKKPCVLNNSYNTQINGQFDDPKINNCTKLPTVINEINSPNNLGNATKESTINKIDFALSLDDSDFEVNTTPKELPENITSPNLTNNSKTLSKTLPFPLQTNCQLSILNLPDEILNKYKCRNITQLFPWQVECLSLPGVLDESQNLIYSAPTSAGKTIVSEILAIKTVLERKKKVLMILPFVSLVREKLYYFQDILGTSGVRVEGFMGGYNPPGGFRNVQMAICTIEKANSLVNRLLEEDKLERIGLVIVDELHLLGDSGRGYLLELLLTKLQYIGKRCDDVQIQIVGMSATLPNLNVLGQWLNAAVYTTDFRPIPLHEQCLAQGRLLNSQLESVRVLETIPELKEDTDNVLQLCLETISNNCSVLIFCPSKNWVESLALQLSSAVYTLGTSGGLLGLELRKQLDTLKIRECLEQLKLCPVGLDQQLRKSVSFGVAFHHAGLTLDERDIIEGAFRSGALRVLVATSTLSSGVNLPARRVIIRTPMFYGKPLDSLTYKQMVGRAGRMGKDSEGESILICQKKDLEMARELMSTHLKPVTSCLESSGRLKRALLEIIASEVARTKEDLNLFAQCTLLAQEQEENVCLVQESLEFLVECQFVRLQVQETDTDGGGVFIATALAKACLSSSMPPEEGLQLFAELEKARQCFVLESDLHIIYLVTPYSAQLSSIDWMHYLDLWEKMPKSNKRVADLVGIKMSYLISASQGKFNSKYGSVHKRFYTSLALQDLINEMPLNVVANKFGCSRGALQGLQQSAASFAGMVTAFCRELGWNSVELLISQFQDRLEFGVCRELLDLMRLPLLNAQRARSLFNAGIKSLVDLASCDAYELENILHKCKPFESAQREGESKFDANRRNELKTFWITGKEGITELEAAKLVVTEARKFLQLEIGVNNANWSMNNEQNSVNNITNKEQKEKQEESETKRNEESCRLSLESLEISQKTTKTQILDSSSDENNLSQLQPKSLNSENNSSEICGDSDSVIKQVFENTFNVSNASDDLFLSPSKSHEKMETDDDNADDFIWEVLDVCKTEELFECFLEEFEKHEVISLALACEYYEKPKKLIGLNKKSNKEDIEDYVHGTTKTVGIAVYWFNYTNTVCFVDVSKTRDTEILDRLWKMIAAKRELRMFDGKGHLKLLANCLRLPLDMLKGKIRDPLYGDWLLDPQEEQKDLFKMVEEYLPELKNVLDSCASKFHCLNNNSLSFALSTGCKNGSGIVRACIEVLINYQLMDALIRKMEMEHIFLQCFDLEMKIMQILAQMELNGIRIDLNRLQNLADTLRLHLKSIETKAYNLAGRRFSFTSNTDVGRVLNIEKKHRKRVISVNKQVLSSCDNPLSNLIMQWRKINSTLTKMIMPLLRNVREDNRIHGTCISHNVTGRISMYEPNIQNVPRNFEFVDPITNFKHEISCRKCFVCDPKHVLISADFCQLELRILAHYSQDEALRSVVSQKGNDIFRLIAAKWLKVSEVEVSDEKRQQTKVICYGIIYGIGMKALAEQMNVSEEEAQQFTEAFHRNYPRVRTFIRRAVDQCREKGFVDTLTGRRRFLPNINSEILAEKSKCERQAVNTIIQGSAADIAKHAMVSIDAVVEEKFKSSRNVPKLLVQLHDELLYQVNVKYEDIFARILSKCMETCVKLSVPLPVKIQTGQSWGDLKLK